MLLNLAIEEAKVEAKKKGEPQVVCFAHVWDEDFFEESFYWEAENADQAPHSRYRNWVRMFRVYPNGDLKKIEMPKKEKAEKVKA